MQGIIGCYIKRNFDQLPTANQVLDKMLSVLKHNIPIIIKRVDFQNFSLSILSLKHNSLLFEPLFINQGNKQIFIDGFIKNRESFLNNLKKEGNLLKLLSSNQASGIFNLISFDQTNNELVIANDRHGAKYLYYYEDEDCFIFAPNPKVILASGLVKNKSIDYQAIISLISHEYIMGDRSLVESIKLFPYASYLILNKNNKELKQYWNFDSLLSKKNNVNYDDLLKEGTTLLKSAIESYAAEGEKIIIPLSGGLDSRTIASFIADKADCQALHIDYGFEKKYAQKIAETLKLDLEIYPLKLWQPWDAIDPFILCSSNSIHQFWIYPFLKKKILKDAGTLVLDGYLMNEVIGGVTTLKFNDFSNINKIYRPLKKDFDFILGTRVKKDFYIDHETQLAEIIKNFPGDDNYDRYLYFTILNYGRRYTLLFSVIHQYIVNVGLPILDYELMDFCLQLPFQVRINSRFYRDMISRSFPQIARIPWSRNRLPLNSPKKRSFIIDLQKKIAEYKYNLTRITNTKIETLPKHNKNRRFRKDKEFREYFMKIVFDDRTFDKGYISKSGLEKLIKLIDSGRNYFRLIEQIALIELVTRELEIG